MARHSQSLDLRPLQAPLFLARLHAAGVQQGLFLEAGPAPDEKDLSRIAQLRRINDFASLLQGGRRALFAETVDQRARLRAAESMLCCEFGDCDTDAKDLPDEGPPPRCKTLMPAHAIELLPLAQAVGLAAIEEAMDEPEGAA